MGDYNTQKQILEEVARKILKKGFSGKLVYFSSYIELELDSCPHMRYLLGQH